MILVDIGNTNLHFARARKGKIEKLRYLPTAKASRGQIKKFLAQYPKDNFLICSVVPPLTEKFKVMKKSICGDRRMYIVGKEVKVPIRCLYNKKKVGMDRLVGALFAKKTYSSTRLIIDFGTAITFDFISKKGSYLGGFILPGITLSLKALSTCSLLPRKINLKEISRLIPKETKESISKGIKEGFSAMVNSLVKKYKKHLNLSPKERVIVTGGDASVILPHLDFPLIYEPLLVLKGLLFLSTTLSSSKPDS